MDFSEAKPKKTRKRKVVDTVTVMEVDTADVERNTRSEENGKSRPHYPPFKKQRTGTHIETRRVPVPAHRYTPLKENWLKIFTPLVEHLKVQVRFNLKTRNVEIRNSAETEDIGNLQKAADFVKAFILGFEPDDALALLRLEDLFVESFDVTDVKPLKGDHLSRAIGRLAGKGGRTKFTIENVTKTRIVLADSKIHILDGSEIASPPEAFTSSLRPTRHVKSITLLVLKSSAPENYLVSGMTESLTSGGRLSAGGGGGKGFVRRLKWSLDFASKLVGPNIPSLTLFLHLVTPRHLYHFRALMHIDKQTPN
ncbi:unnamed protein product [Cyprideis torosa]|uniref:PNO1 second type I KH domain-containing protein n=1 Tax=Cyprideis torosa TaxID=163714 RepID=A0A7R8ZKE2_9CRUS|nr:unnamed protein product [Cyprideis torosa]CAG0880023.1 unnamed protein product [Cyprideis torosa]